MPEALPLAYLPAMEATSALARFPPWARDGLVGLAITGVGLITALRDAGPQYAEPDGLAFALAMAATVPYLIRRVAPLPVLIVTALATAALMVQDYDAGALPLVLLFGTYTVGSLRPISEVITGIVAMETVLVLLFVADVPAFGLGELVTSAIAFAGAMGIGWSLQSRRRRIEGFDQEQAEATRRAAADERMRIAQEIHDVIAHSLGVIAVQAGVGMHVIDTDPAEAKRALEHISRMSRSSLTDVRWLLGRVRDPDGTPSYRPAPGLSDLGRLADEVGGAGLAVHLRVDDGLDGVPPGVGLAAYRIVQEALTNALRHAEASTADVRVGLEAGVLEVEVTDDGLGGEQVPGGHGLVGMGERAKVYGGSVDAGPGPEGGFRVRARLPCTGVPA
jgi:signal transduction histidine kinase